MLQGCKEKLISSLFICNSFVNKPAPFVNNIYTYLYGIIKFMHWRLFYGKADDQLSWNILSENCSPNRYLLRVQLTFSTYQTSSSSYILPSLKVKDSSHIVILHIQTSWWLQVDSFLSYVLFQKDQNKAIIFKKSNNCCVTQVSHGDETND